jgi:hypothetical protein
MGGQGGYRQDKAGISLRALRVHSALDSAKLSLDGEVCLESRARRANNDDRAGPDQATLSDLARS